MSYAFVILGLLAEKSRHAYEMKQMIQLRGIEQYVRLSGGGLHYHIGKLLESHYIELESVKRDKNYPERQIYSITALGREFLAEELRNTLIDVEGRRYYDPLDAALAFAGVLPTHEVVIGLEHQLHQIQGVLMRLQMLQKRMKSEAIKFSCLDLIVEHSITRKEAELTWLTNAIAQLRSAPPTLLEDDRLQNLSSSQEWIDLETKLLAAQKIYQSKIQAAFSAYRYMIASPVESDSNQNEQNYQAAVLKAHQEYEAALHTILDSQKEEV